MACKVKEASVKKNRFSVVFNDQFHGASAFDVPGTLDANPYHPVCKAKEMTAGRDHMVEVVIAGAARTAMGGFQGTFSELSAVDLGGATRPGLMMLAASPGSEIDITAHGTDADAALAALKSLVETGFGEED